MDAFIEPASVALPVIGELAVIVARRVAANADVSEADEPCV